MYLASGVFRKAYTDLLPFLLQGKRAFANGIEIFTINLCESGVYDGISSIVFFYGTKRRPCGMIAGIRPAIIFCNRKKYFLFLK